MSFTHVIQMGVGVGVLHLKQMKSNTPVWHNSHRTRSRMMNITMRDRSKNRKPLQKGRNLSIEAIQTVQALKRAANLSEASLDQVFDNRFRRLLKFDMIAVLRELLRQNQCLLALKVFRDIRKEEWYRPQLLLYAEMITVLGSNGLLEKALYNKKLPVMMEASLFGIGCCSRLPFLILGGYCGCMKCRKQVADDRSLEVESSHVREL
ncbi:pentatricopeptide repeat-containing protein At1g62350 isoform X2 [Sesamum indicum]|uniref:Pentatricopeptide repeat-containing protein At1g62350 isoform X2 n=1 Tax=Sesamum indicum TaxID=4182 RepID=A0A8M8V4M6_SESIN|nr:pentatricopeptide repeat-containing protein At1g62350 isoform X2 [Sesamum indicum]